jgi:hypothetical protein
MRVRAVRLRALAASLERLALDTSSRADELRRQAHKLRVGANLLDGMATQKSRPQ